MKLARRIYLLALIAQVLIASPLSASPTLAAEASTASMLLYIQPQEYKNPIRLNQYSRVYWYEQGPLVEAAAVKVLGTEFGQVGMCDSKQLPTNVLVWLRPRMFFNPQMQVYHGKITAVAYTASGKPIASYVGESSQPGFLDVKPEQKIGEVYQLAMQSVAAKMKADASLQSLLAATSSTTENKTPCALVSLLPEPKVQMMSF